MEADDRILKDILEEIKKLRQQITDIKIKLDTVAQEVHQVKNATTR